MLPCSSLHSIVALCDLDLGSVDILFWGFLPLSHHIFCDLFCRGPFQGFHFGFWSFLGWYLILVTSYCLDLGLKHFQKCEIALSRYLACRDNLRIFSFSLSFLGFFSAFSCTPWMFFSCWILDWVLVRTSLYFFS